MALTKANNRMIDGAVVNVFDYGAVGNGIADDTAAAQAAVDAIKDTGGTVYFPKGKYLLNGTTSADTSGSITKNGISIGWKDAAGFYGSKYGIKLVGDSEGGSYLLAGSSNMALVRISRGHCIVENLSFEGGLTSNATYSSYPTPPSPVLSGTVGVLIGPENLAGVIDQITISYNTVKNCTINWCDLGIHVQTPPAASGSYHMTFRNIHFTDNNVGIRYFYPADFNTGAGTLNLSTAQLIDKCQFNYGNVGVYADAVSGLNINTCYFENIKDGTSPLTTPASVYIPAKNAVLSYGHEVYLNNCEIECSAGGEKPLDNSDPSTLLNNTGFNRTTSTGDTLCKVVNGRAIDSDSKIVHYRAKQPDATNGNSIFEVSTLSGAASVYTAGDIYLGSATNNANDFATSTAQASILYTSAGGLNLKADPNNISAASVITLSVDGTTVYSASSSLAEVTNKLVPSVSGSYSLGDAASLWSEVFASTGTINTSDEREKEQIRDLNQAEQNVATALKGLIKAFKYKKSVADKGDSARIHVGVIAQEVKAAFEAQGLDAFDYGVLCYDQWYARDEITDEKTGDILMSGSEAGDRYGIRYDELWAFVISAL